MLPSEVLDAHGDLLERVQHSEEFRTIIWRFGAVDTHPNGTEEELEKQGDTLLRTFEASVRHGYTYRVTYDMCTLLEAGAMELPEGQTWDLSRAPTEHGFVRFDKPLEVRDVRGKTMLAHFLVWGRVSTPTTTGSMLWFFNDILTQADETAWTTVQRMVADMPNEKFDSEKKAQELYEQIRQATGRWENVTCILISHGHPLGPVIIDPTQPNVRMDNRTLADLIERAENAQVTTNMRRYVHALWSTLHQTITVTTEEFPNRASRRRAERRGLPGKVTVISLRRAEYPTRREGEGLVEWSHRWYSRDHWGWRKCGEHHPLAEPDPRGGWHCWVAIAGSVKGPADKPLVITEKVMDLRR